MMNKLAKYLDQDIESMGYQNCSFDWSAFDRNMPAEIIETAFDLLKERIDFTRMDLEDGSVTTLTDKKAKQYENVWNFIKFNFINTKMNLPDGRVFRKKHGIPSGSGFTQIIGTICNMLMIFSLTRAQGINPQQAQFLGDDSSFMTTSELVPVNFMSIMAERLFGAILNVQKTEVTSKNGEFGFLGYKMRSGAFIQSTMKLFHQLLYVERPIKKVETSLLRAVPYYCLGGQQDPLFSEYFSHLRNKYRGWDFKNAKLVGGLGKFMDIVNVDTEILKIAFESRNEFDFRYLIS